MNVENHRLLILFVRNPVEGEVKTRLAASIGEAEALRIYRKLLSHTRSVASRTDAARQVWYADRIDHDDAWESPLFSRYLQSQGDLGERMSHAFERAFRDGFTTVVIIGSDCPTLTPDHITNAFDALDRYDVVTGPSRDGGYYLLGMNQFRPELFRDKPWSRPGLYRETVNEISRLNLCYRELEVLNDIDTIEDLVDLNNGEP